MTEKIKVDLQRKQHLHIDSKDGESLAEIIDFANHGRNSERIKQQLLNFYSE